MNCSNTNTFKQSDCCNNSLPTIKVVYIMEEGVLVYRKTNGELFTYQNDEAGHKALMLIKKLEMWKTKFKPQRQVIIWILPLLAILFGLAVIAWYVLVRF